MTIIQSIILGIVEGLTEFVPISSTFHLIWASQLLQIPHTTTQKIFEVVIQAGAIGAALCLYAKRLAKDLALAKKILVSFVPTAVIGFVLYNAIKGFFFENYALQLGIFALVGILFIIFEKFHRPSSVTRPIFTLSYAEAFWIGIAQAAAVIPGVSRSGAVLVALISINIKREEAAEYSFMLAIPTILAAAALDIYKSRHLLIASSHDTLLLFIGFMVAGISAFAVMKWLIAYLQHHSLALFGWYRLAVAAALTLWLF